MFMVYQDDRGCTPRITVSRDRNLFINAGSTEPAEMTGLAVLFSQLLKIHIWFQRN